MAEAPYPDPPERPYPARPSSPVPRKSFAERASISIDKNVEEALKHLGLEGVRKKDLPKGAAGESTGAKPKKVVRSPKSTESERQTEATKKEDSKRSIADGLRSATRVGITAVPQAAPLIPEPQPAQESRRGMFRSFSDRILRRLSTGYDLLPPAPPSNASSRTPQSDHSSHLSTSIDPEIFELHGSSTYSESSVGPMPDLTVKLALKELREEGIIDDASTSESMTYEPHLPFNDHEDSPRRRRHHYNEESDDYATSSDPAPLTSTSEEATDTSSEPRTEAQQATAAATERPRRKNRFPQLSGIFKIYALERGPDFEDASWVRMGNGNNNGGGEDPQPFYNNNNGGGYEFYRRRVYYEETWIEERRYEARSEDGSSDADVESDEDGDEDILSVEKEYDEHEMYSSESVSEKWDVSSRYESRDSGISGSDGNVVSVSESRVSDGRETPGTGSSRSVSVAPGAVSSGSGRITPEAGSSSASSIAPGSGKAESGSVSDGDGAGNSGTDSIASGDGKAGSGNVSDGDGAVSSGTDSIASGDGKAGSGSVSGGAGSSGRDSITSGDGKSESGNVSDGDGAVSSGTDSIASGDGKAGSGGAGSSGTDSIASGDGKAGTGDASPLNQRSGCPADTTEVRPPEYPEPRSFLARILQQLPSRHPPQEANTLPHQKEEESQKSVRVEGACPAWTEEYIRNSPVFWDGDNSVKVTCDWDELGGFRMSTRSYRSDSSSSGSTDVSDSDEESDRN